NHCNNSPSVFRCCRHASCSVCEQWTLWAPSRRQRRLSERGAIAGQLEGPTMSHPDESLTTDEASPKTLEIFSHWPILAILVSVAVTVLWTGWLGWLLLQTAIALF